ncbi:MAG: endonuclease III domain-containing protein [Lachnospiraceae bacterium]|nr:endonuclease III domain-containing protein [Lachnospiraceae bacterium]
MTKGTVDILKIYQILHTHYGNLDWWPAKTPYEVMVGAVLTQNTAWDNVEKAIANFTDLSPQFIQDCDIAKLAEIIHPAGFFNQKAVYLKAVTAWFAKYNFDVSTVQRVSLEKIRPEFLSVKGVGKETADSILLYAFGYPTFVVDAYTARLCQRYPLDVDKGYDVIKAYFENSLPHDTKLYNNYHAMIVMNAKEHCRKSRPLCEKCPLVDICKKKF